MKVSESKINSTGVHLQKKANEPFFNKRIGESFFSKSNDTPNNFFRASSIQTKLSIGQPNDVYEKEADAMADKVVQRQAQPEVKIQREHAIQTKPFSTAFTPFVQTKCARCEEEDKLQKKEKEDVKLLNGKLQKKPIFESNVKPKDDDKNIQRKCAECEKEEKPQKKPLNIAAHMRNNGIIQRKPKDSKLKSTAKPSTINVNISMPVPKADPAPDYSLGMKQLDAWELAQFKIVPRLFAVVSSLKKDGMSHSFVDSINWEFAQSDFMYFIASEILSGANGTLSVDEIPGLTNPLDKEIKIMFMRIHQRIKIHAKEHFNRYRKVIADHSSSLPAKFNALPDKVKPSLLEETDLTDYVNSYLNYLFEKLNYDLWKTTCDWEKTDYPNLLKGINNISASLSTDCDKKSPAVSEEPQMPIVVSPGKQKPPVRSQSPAKSKIQKKSIPLNGDNTSENIPSDNLENKLNTTRSSGESLPLKVRKQMGNSFGADFSNVKIHTDNTSVQLNNKLNAQAFTHGNDIYFNAGKYDTSSDRGKHLLAHELTHTIQQKNIGNAALLRKEVKEHGEGKALDDVKASCDGVADVTPGVAKEQKIPQVQYAIDSDKIHPLIVVAFNEFVKQWHLRGGKETVDIFGYASTDGAEEFNWRLSCRRANSLKNILLRPPDGSPGIPVSFITTHAQGETEKFGSGEVENRVATIVSVIPLKPAEVCPPCDQTGVRSSNCPPCANILPDVPVPVDPVGPIKPNDTPAFFCVPYTDIAQATRDHILVEAEMQLFTSRFGKDIQDLWTTYLENPKTGTKGTLLPRKIFAVQNSRVVNEFRQDDETLKQKDRIMKLLAAKVRGDSALMPAIGQSTPVLNFRAVLANADLLNLPMSFKDPATKIPGNIAGGFGKNSSDAGDDVRNVDGTFIATNLGLSTIKISAAFTFDVLDAVDFCPGAPGGFFAQRVSIPMSRFEATPNFPTYDVPFEVVYGLSDDQSF